VKSPIGASIAMAAGLLLLTTAAGPSEGAREFTVVMKNMRYGPMPEDLHVGDSVVFVNRDTVLHTVTARNRSFDLRIPPKMQARLTMTKAGKISFYCTLHSAMGTRTLEVSDD